MYKGMHSMIEDYINNRSVDVFLKKKSDFIKDVSNYMRLFRNLYDEHFKKVPRTSQNPEFKIDALAWTAIYHEKVDRYSPEVYLMGEYMVKHYQYFQTLSLDDIKKGKFHFDVFRCSLDFQEKLTKINPPLTPEQFEKELDNSSVVKKFFYNYDDPDYELPIDVEVRNVIDHRFHRVGDKIKKRLQKFESFELYDYFNERDEIQEEAQRVKDKYPWKDHQNEDFELFKSKDIFEIRRMYKNEAKLD